LLTSDELAMKNNNTKLSCIFSIIALCLMCHSVAAMSRADVKSEDLKTKKVQVSLNKSKLITLDREVAEITQGNFEIANIKPD